MRTVKGLRSKAAVSWGRGNEAEAARRRAGDRVRGGSQDDPASSTKPDLVAQSSLRTLGCQVPSTDTRKQRGMREIIERRQG